jgi:hypothetical protein
MTVSKDFPRLARYRCHLVDLRLDELICQVLVLALGSTLAWHLEVPVLPVRARKRLLSSEVGDGLHWVLIEEFGSEQVLV